MPVRFLVKTTYIADCYIGGGWVSQQKIGEGVACRRGCRPRVVKVGSRGESPIRGRGDLCCFPAMEIRETSFQGVAAQHFGDTGIERIPVVLADIEQQAVEQRADSQTVRADRNRGRSGVRRRRIHISDGDGKLLISRRWNIAK